MIRTITKIVPVCIEVEVTVEIDERPGTRLDPPECTIDWKINKDDVIEAVENEIHELINDLDYD